MKPMVAKVKVKNPAKGPKPNIATKKMATIISFKVRDAAMLVRGTDKYHHFDYEPRPQGDLDAAALAAHADSVARQVKALYSGTEKQEFRA